MGVRFVGEISTVKELSASCCDPEDEVGYVSIFNGKTLMVGKDPYLTMK
jgi:hypothetical protein